MRIAALAASQHGVVSRAQLTELGVGRGAIEHRVQRRRLHAVGPKVYAVGHPVLSREARWMAAVLAGGRRAVLSHWSAASLWGIRSGSGPLSHVTVPRRRRSNEAITFHFADLPEDEVSEQDGIPVTVPGRVILDLGPFVSLPSLTRAVEQIERMGIAAGPSIQELLDRYPRRAGTPKLRRLATEPLAVTRSELEALFLYLISSWSLPAPQMNTGVEGYEVDCVWPQHSLIVELDGFETHRTSAAFERDRERDRRLQAAGWTVIRITWRQLTAEPGAVRADLARLLSR